jgi:hypothetical protein
VLEYTRVMKPLPSITITTKLWRYPGHAAWHFITIPKAESSAITVAHGAHKRGWGSLPVTVKVREVVWQTSIFPESKTGTYLLPVKASIRKSEGLFAGDEVTCMISF